jgi:hypothetical protein
MFYPYRWGVILEKNQKGSALKIKQRNSKSQKKYSSWDLEFHAFGIFLE